MRQLILDVALQNVLALMQRTVYTPQGMLIASYPE